MGIHEIISLTVTAALLLYGVAIIRMTAALLRKGKPADMPPCNNGGNGGNAPGVSIVIPFRNEEHNLGALLESIAKQSYTGMIEVIFVDDRSEDNGAEVIKKYMRTVNNISIKIIDLNTCGIPFKNIQKFKQLTTKQQALDIGVNEARLPLIAFTDADMILSPDWITSLVDTHLSTKADLVFGHTAIMQNFRREDATGGGRRFMSVMESYQLDFLFAFACAFSRLNMTGSCMGNNILVTKESYWQCGGQQGIGRSMVEDRALLETMRKRKFKTAAAEPFRVTAMTYPSQSMKQFLNQMARWAAGGLRPGGGLFIAALLTLTQNAAFTLAALCALSLTIFPVSFIRGVTTGIFFPAGLVNPEAPVYTIIPAAAAAINFMLTWLFTTIAFKKHRSPTSAWMYPIYYIFMMLETVVFGLMLIFNQSVTWKGRVIKSKSNYGGEVSP